MKKGIGALNFALICFAGYLVSCASTRPNPCSQNFADQLGYDEAAKWKAGKPGLQQAAKCEGEYTSKSFAQDYNRGFGRRQKEVCSLGFARKLGEKHAKNQNFEDGSDEYFTICSKKRVLTEAYLTVFDNHFCQSDRFNQLGQKHGEDLNTKKDGSVGLKCPREKRPDLITQYLNGYTLGLKSACSLSQLYLRGRRHGTASRSKEKGMKELDLCIESVGYPALQAYTDGYHHARVESENVRQQKRKAEAQKKYRRRSLELLEAQAKEQEEFHRKQLEILKRKNAE